MLCVIAVLTGPFTFLSFRFFIMFRLQAKFLNVAGRQFQKRQFLRALASCGSQNSYVNEIKDAMVNQHVAKLKQEKVPSGDAVLKIAFFSNKHNSMSQRLCLELERRNHQVKVMNHEGNHSRTDQVFVFNWNITVFYEIL